MTSYKLHSVDLTDGQKQSLAKAYNQRAPVTLRLKHNQLSGNFPLLLTNSQINHINKAKQKGTGVDVNISKSQISAQSKNGGFLGALAGYWLELFYQWLQRFFQRLLPLLQLEL